MKYGKRPYGNLFNDGITLKICRLKSSKQQKQISEELGFIGNKLSLIENGQHRPNKEQIEKLLKYYGIKITDLNPESDMVTILNEKDTTEEKED